MKENNFWGKVADTISKYWVGFCVGWIWFGKVTNFWKLFGIEILGLILIWIACGILDAITGDL